METLAGKTAIVTGAGRGIGRTEAIQLAGLGANVVVTDLTGSSVVADEIRALGGQASALDGDISDWTTAQAVVRHAIDTFGDLDVLINNAGISRPAMSFNMTEQEWDDVIRVHLKGSFAPTHFAAIHWRERSKRAGGPVAGAVVNTSSGNGLNGGTPGHVNYAVAKSGIGTMTTALARELAPYGVRCNAVAPLAYTDMTKSLWGTELFPDDHPPELEPENIAAVVGWLASPQSSEVTGQVIEVRGSECWLWRSWKAIASVSIKGAWTVGQMDKHGMELFDGTYSGLADLTGPSFEGY